MSGMGKTPSNMRVNAMADDFSQPGAGTPVTPQPGAPQRPAPPPPPQPKPQPQQPVQQPPPSGPMTGPPPGMQGPDTHAPMPGPGVHTIQRARHIPFVAIAIVVVMLIVAVVAIKVIPHPSNTTSTTTTVATNLMGIKGCGAISSPGTYTLQSNISARIDSGTCINITASNVNLECGGGRIIGNGPYDGLPPFTIGVRIGGSNDAVHRCTISNFSYGVFAAPTSNLNISNDNISANYMSDIYFSGASNSTIANDKLYRTTSFQGAINMTNSSANNRIINNTILYNLRLGVYVNATGDTFYNDYINGSPLSYYCTPGAGVRKNNALSGGLCYNNTGCSFAFCKGYNIPTNLSRLTLTSAISGCGSIDRPGVYSMAGDINMDDYINVTAVLAGGYQVSCLNINSDNIVLNCNGHEVSNATTAISAYGRSNITLENCRVSTADTGISFNNVSSSHLDNVSVNGSNIGIELINSNVDFITNATTSRDVYGMYLSNSTTDTVNRFAADRNEYGLFVEDSLGNIFNSGQLLNNSKLDVYASYSSANSTYNLMTATSCGVTNAAWAPCTTHTTANLLFIPVTSCISISRAGNYSLTSGILTSRQSCIAVNSSNVNLECHYYAIVSSSHSSGTAIGVYNATNVTIDGCRTSGFAHGVSAFNSVNVSVVDSSTSGGSTGIMLNSTSGSLLSNDTVKLAGNYSIALVSASSSSVLHDNVSYGPGQSIGIYLNGSRRNTVANNTGSSNYLGMDLTGGSQNNTIYYNTMSLSGKADYACSPQDSLIDSERGGVNYGATKIGCHWLAVVTPASAAPCIATFAPEDFSLGADAVYSIGTVCLGVYGNGTTLNCNGHTIIATAGGTLMSVRNSRGTVLENCFVKGFNVTIQAVNSSVTVLNNTVYANRSARYGPSINLTGVSNIKVDYNNVTTPYYGISLSNAQYGTVSSNRASGGVVSYLFQNVSGLTIENNTAYPGSGIGMLLNSSTVNLFHVNSLGGVTLGLQCTGGSTSTTADTDEGGNMCSSESNCGWISESSSTCRS